MLLRICWFSLILLQRAIAHEQQDDLFLKELLDWKQNLQNWTLFQDAVKKHQELEVSVFL